MHGLLPRQPCIWTRIRAYPSPRIRAKPDVDSDKHDAATEAARRFRSTAAKSESNSAHSEPSRPTAARQAHGLLHHSCTAVAPPLPLAAGLPGRRSQLSYVAGSQRVGLSRGE